MHATMEARGLPHHGYEFGCGFLVFVLGRNKIYISEYNILYYYL